MKPRRPTKPRAPFCVNELMNTHTCSDSEVRRYNSEVDAYNQGLRNYQAERAAYVAQLKRYIDAAGDYAECELREMDGGY